VPRKAPRAAVRGQKEPVGSSEKRGVKKEMVRWAVKRKEGVRNEPRNRRKGKGNGR